MVQYVQIDLSVNKRQSKWVITCSECQHEKFVSYCQVWNIKKGKCGSLCRKCSPKNYAHLKNYKNYSVVKRSNSKAMSYVNFWGKGFVTDAGRSKQRNAKLGIAGVKANAYVDGRTSENKKLRNSDKYKQLRKQVFKRDSFTCVLCGKIGGELNMDHIKPWCKAIELRFDADNCRTLCKPCHLKTDTYGTKAKGYKL